MAQAGYTPIQLYFSTTAAAVPLAANLAQGELAINIVDGKLYYENNSGVVTLLASAAGAAGDVVGPASATDNALARFDTTTGKLIQNSVAILSDAGVLTGLTGLTSSGNVTLSSLTATRVPYASTGGLLVDSANLTFDGTTLVANNFTDSSLTSGRVTYAGTGGNLVDSANLTFDGTTLTANALTVTNATTLSGGTANGVAYLNGSKVLTTGSALTFNGTSLGVGSSSYGDAGTITASIGVPGTTTGGLQLWSTTSGQHFVSFGDGTSGTDTYRGYVGYAHASDALIFGASTAEQMRLTSTGLGIGTSSPSQKLTVAGGIASTTGISALAASTAFFDFNGGNARFAAVSGTTGTAAPILFSQYSSNGSVGRDAMTIDSSGNLGLGVTPTGQSKFQVYTGNNAINGIQTQFNGSNPPIALASTTSNGFPYVGFNTVQVVNSDNQTYATSGFASRISHVQGGNGGFQFNVAPSGTAGNAISFTQAMTLDASGRLTLGTTAASTGFSSISLSGGPTGANTGIQLTYNASTFGGGAITTVNAAGGGLSFYTFTGNVGGESYSERARITSGGDLLVGTTSANAKVTVQTTTNQRSIQLDATNSSTFTDVIIYANGYRNTTNGSWKYLSCAINGVGEKLQIIDSGTVNNATGTYGTISDARLKQDIVDAPSQWSDIKAIRFRKYRMKLDVESNPNAPTMLGVVAQELELVSPNLVDESNNEDGTTTKTVKQSILLMKAAVALQEAMTRIEQLEARLDAANL